MHSAISVVVEAFIGHTSSILAVMKNVKSYSSAMQSSSPIFMYANSGYTWLKVVQMLSLPILVQLFLGF